MLQKAPNCESSGPESAKFSATCSIVSATLSQVTSKRAAALQTLASASWKTTLLRSDFQAGASNRKDRLSRHSGK
jgi:hypothetical protein